MQRPVLPPGTLAPIHLVGFLVITSREVFGMPATPELAALAARRRLGPDSFGLTPDQLRVTVTAPEGERDVIGLVTALEGQPQLPSGDIASRIGGFEDIAKMEGTPEPTDAELIDVLLASKNGPHNNYRDFQAFLDSGGRIGLQRDPLLYGAYLLNPFLVRVEMVPMQVVNQGEVAVIKAFVGLPTLHAPRCRPPKASSTSWPELGPGSAATRHTSISGCSAKLLPSPASVRSRSTCPGHS